MRELVELLVCPVCRGALARAGADAGLDCTACGIRYAVHEDIPVLVPPGTARSHKEQQIAFFDEPSRDDFGITRPRGAPPLYRWLLEEKFRRSVIGLEDLLPGATALTVCGGSGPDAEFLAAAGARVIVSDIALGVVLQARERARRYGLDLALVVADVEALPFRDASIDVVYVHDGLHHLERPLDGLAEMTRVAGRAVSISEPAAAAATKAAVRLGLAESEEEAGNEVRRLTLDGISRALAEHGFVPVRPHRYAMLYRHWPGRAMRILSLPPVLPLAQTTLSLFNAVLGRFGNKLTVQGRRA
jgi:ubiquinone/menaquinone biosynthesis C-methylase UbiE/uncharacterized protein YbaR (Trm112 family)